MRLTSANEATVGITDFAQSALGDVVFVDLPEVGAVLAKGDAFGSVESVKAASSVYAPVAGKVQEVNQAVKDDNSLVNKSADKDGWMIKVHFIDTATDFAPHWWLVAAAAAPCRPNSEACIITPDPLCARVPRFACSFLACLFRDCSSS